MAAAWASRAQRYDGAIDESDTPKIGIPSGVPPGTLSLGGVSSTTTSGESIISWS